MTKKTVQITSVTLAQSAADTQSPSLQDMRIFLIVAQESSFSAAARLLGLSPASISRHMKALEDGLQVRLLNRTTRTLTLTEAGQLFSTKVEAILGDVSQMCEQLRDTNAKPQGLLRVNSRVLVGHEHICQLLPGFNSRYPDIRVDLSLSNETIDLVGNYIDLDIRIGQLPDSSLIAKKLIRSERWLCATPDYLAAHGDVPRSPADLTQFQCLTYRPGLEPVVWRFRKPGGQLEEISIDGFLQTNSGTALKICTLGGLGISLMPDWSVAREIQQGQLVRLLPDYEISFTTFENGIFAVYPAGRHFSMRSRVFIDYLTEYFRRLRHELKIDQ